MKSFAVTLVIFFVLISFIIINYVFVNRYSECLSDMTEALPEIGADDCIDKIVALTDEWQKHRCFISFSAGISSLQNIDDLLDSLLVAKKSENEHEFEKAKAILINAFDGLAQFESFAPEDIF